MQLDMTDVETVALLKSPNGTTLPSGHDRPCVLRAKLSLEINPPGRCAHCQSPRHEPETTEGRACHAALGGGNVVPLGDLRRATVSTSVMSSCTSSA